jgi:hypothetical protein
MKNFNRLFIVLVFILCLVQGALAQVIFGGGNPAIGVPFSTEVEKGNNLRGMAIASIGVKGGNTWTAWRHIPMANGAVFPLPAADGDLTLKLDIYGVGVYPTRGDSYPMQVVSTESGTMTFESYNPRERNTKANGDRTQIFFDLSKVSGDNGYVVIRYSFERVNGRARLKVFFVCLSASDVKETVNEFLVFPTIRRDITGMHRFSSEAQFGEWFRLARSEPDACSESGTAFASQFKAIFNPSAGQTAPKKENAKIVDPFAEGQGEVQFTAPSLKPDLNGQDQVLRILMGSASKVKVTFVATEGSEFVGGKKEMVKEIKGTMFLKKSALSGISLIKLSYERDGKVVEEKMEVAAIQWPQQ